jgi:heme/copper-type cytochrome/quinol oxidase subunit 4
MLFLSLAIGTMKDARLATILIFSIATVKAYLVLMYYMGLKWEPKQVHHLLFSAFALMLVLLLYLVPDIVFVYGHK